MPFAVFSTKTKGGGRGEFRLGLKIVLLILFEVEIHNFVNSTVL